uniref:Uncharacterized protein n=1 Tax=Arundo donax TaxID=35708 RepID=A0A0A9HCH6_ARUDO
MCSSSTTGIPGCGPKYCNLDFIELANQAFSLCCSLAGSALEPSITSMLPLIRNCSQLSVKYQQISPKGQLLISPILLLRASVLI